MLQKFQLRNQAEKGLSGYLKPSKNKLQDNIYSTYGTHFLPLVSKLTDLPIHSNFTKFNLMKFEFLPQNSNQCPPVTIFGFKRNEPVRAVTNTKRLSHKKGPVPITRSKF